MFVNATLDEVALAADRFGLSLLQLHGDEGPAYCREAARRTGAKVMKSARVTPGRIGLDRWLLPLLGTPWRPGLLFTHRTSTRPMRRPTARPSSEVRRSA